MHSVIYLLYYCLLWINKLSYSIITFLFSCMFSFVFCCFMHIFHFFADDVCWHPIKAYVGPTCVHVVYFSLISLILMFTRYN